MTDTARNALGDFLRSRREKLEPHAIGLPNGARRRTVGLRRQEVAELAGIGIDWYIRLEQGRAVRPSPATVDALARALRLDEAEHAHLRALALPSNRPAFMRETVPSTVRRIVERLDQPAYVTGRRWDMLAWNDAACTLFTNFGRMAIADCNILVYVLTDRTRGACSMLPGPGRRRAWWPGSVERTTYELATRRSPVWCAVCASAAPSSPAGGTHTRLPAAPRPARSFWFTPTTVRCATSMRRFRSTTTRRCGLRCTLQSSPRRI